MRFYIVAFLALALSGCVTGNSQEGGRIPRHASWAGQN